MDATEAVAYEKLTDGVPYLVWGHSAGLPSHRGGHRGIVACCRTAPAMVMMGPCGSQVGTWVGFEFLMLCRKAWFWWLS